MGCLRPGDRSDRSQSYVPLATRAIPKRKKVTKGPPGAPCSIVPSYLAPHATRDTASLQPVMTALRRASASKRRQHPGRLSLDGSQPPAGFGSLGPLAGTTRAPGAPKFDWDIVMRPLAHAPRLDAIARPLARSGQAPKYLLRLLSCPTCPRPRLRPSPRPTLARSHPALFTGFLWSSCLGVGSP